MAGAERKETVNVPLKALYRAITDFDSYPQFVTGVKTCRTVSGTDAEKVVEFDVEMMKRIQYSIRAKSQIDEAAGTATVNWQLEKSEFFKSNNGSWTLKALGPTQTEAVYRLDLEFNMSVPGFILKGLVANALPSAIKEFGTRAATLK